MSQDNNLSRCFGVFIIVFVIAAALLGSDEPAMQTDQAAIVMTALIMIGVIMIANSGRKSQNYSQPAVQPAPSFQRAEMRDVNFCPKCGASITTPDARFCSKCGYDLHA